MEHFDELITVSNVTQEELCRFDAMESMRKKTFRHYHVIHSSGSTGKPGYFIYDQDAWEEMLLGIVRGALWGMSISQIVKLLSKRPNILYIAATQGRYGGAMAVGDGIKGVGAKQMYLDINTPLQEWAQRIHAFKPDVIIGYASALKILGELVENDQVTLHVSRVISCGEPLNPGLRTFLEGTFHADVVNIYGASESLALGVETGIEGGMVLFDDLNIIEVENEKMYLTCLYNYAQPLIRYEITDRLILKESLQGSPFHRAEIILARDEDMLWFERENGEQDFLHPLAVEGFCSEGLLDYQFRKTDQFSFEILAEVPNLNKREKIQKEIEEQIKKILIEKKMTHIHFSVRFVKEILPDPRTGKKPLILSDWCAPI